jgi:hypothetical protein
MIREIVGGLINQLLFGAFLLIDEFIKKGLMEFKIKINGRW